MKNKIVVLDSNGMAGHIICQYLEYLEKYEVIKVPLDQIINNDIYFSIEKLHEIEELILNNTPNVIVNCLRLLIKESENDHSKAIFINGYFPHHLSKFCDRINCKIIQLSTDCVFSGRNGNYSENDFTDGSNYYAKTKALGELINNKDLTIRTSFIGPIINSKDEELFHWFMRQEGEIYGYKNAIWSGITTLELAKSIDKIIDLNLSGVYHLVPPQKISKYDLLILIKKIWNKNTVSINKDESVIVDKSLIDNRKEIIIPDYETMLKELFDWMLMKKEQYRFYLKNCDV